MKTKNKEIEELMHQIGKGIDYANPYTVMPALKKLIKLNCEIQAELTRKDMLEKIRIVIYKSEWIHPKLRERVFKEIENETKM